MNKARLKCFILGGACALTLGACHSGATRIYALDALGPRAAVTNPGATLLRVDSVSVPASWDRIEILTPAAGSLAIGDFDHWSAPLPRLARETLSADLDRRLPPGSVVYPRLPKPDGTLGVKVDILEFDVSASQASMRASWLITPPAGSQSDKRGEVMLHEATLSAEPAAVARAWSGLIGELADRIATDAASFSVP